jgi:hypothetical protein
VSSLAAALVLLASIAVATTAAQAPSHLRSGRAVVTTYFGILNAGMMSGDFAALATIYVPDSTLTSCRRKPHVVMRSRRPRHRPSGVGYSEAAGRSHG